MARYGALDKNSFSTSGESENTYYLAVPIFTMRNLLLRQMFLSLSLGRVIPRIQERPPFPLVVDSAGNVCVATLMNGGITVISPDGASVEHIPTPDPLTTNVCFGGPDLKTVYITLTSLGKLVAMDWPRPGLKLHFTR